MSATIRVHTDLMSAVCDAMAIAVCDENWRGSVDMHDKRLGLAWSTGWEFCEQGNGGWFDIMQERYLPMINEFKGLPLRELRAVMRMMTYESGLPFFCAVMALALKMLHGEIDDAQP